MLILGLAVHVWGQRVYGNSVYFLLNFAVNLTALKKSVGGKKKVQAQNLSNLFKLYRKTQSSWSFLIQLLRHVND